MADGTIQLPGDSTGKILDTSDISFGVGSTSRHRERIVIGDPSSTTGLATVTSSAGLQVMITSGVVTATAATNPWSSAPGFNLVVVSASSGLVQVSGTPTIVSASSGLVQISGTPTVTATAGTNPWSSAPGFNIPIVSASSGLVQLSGTPTVLSASSGLIQTLGNVTTSQPEYAAGIQLVTLTTAGHLRVSSTALTQPVSGTVTATGPVTITSGTVTLSSIHTVTATAATNPWSSAPGFNVPLVSASSGLVQISGTPTVTATGPVTITSGTVTLSSVHTVTATAATNPWSSAPGFNIPIVSVSSGLVQISGTPTVTATAATNPWSSAPGFNVPIVSVSSGLIQISGVPLIGVTTSVFSGVGLVTSSMALLGLTTGYLPVTEVTSSGGLLTVSSSYGAMRQLTTGKIVPVLSASSGLVSIDLWQGSSSFAPSFITASTISKISSAPGTLHLLTGFTTSTGGIGATIPALLRLYNNTTSNVEMNSSVRGILPLGMQSSSTSLTGGGDVSNPLMLANFSPIGMFFSSGCSFDIVLTATSTAAVGGVGYITALYSTV